jgi:transcriptional pleiotropic regulator of transition state genes
LKSTGIVRKVDGLGRVVIPVELRKTLGIEEKTPLELFVNGDQIIFRKYQPGCTICGSLNELKFIAGKSLCGACIGEIREGA